MKEIFGVFAQKSATIVGSPWAFLLALLLVVGWALVGPAFTFSDNWQLFINTVTTITTFLMVFLIQNAQNREAKATQLKLDELIRAQKSAHNKLIDVEEQSETALEREKKRLTKRKKRR